MRKKILFYVRQAKSLGSERADESLTDEILEILNQEQEAMLDRLNSSIRETAKDWSENDGRPKHLLIDLEEAIHLERDKL
jgi:hypothetical protein